MNWNTIYFAYEKIALLITLNVVMLWLLMTRFEPHGYFEDIQETLECGLTNVHSRVAVATQELNNDVIDDGGYTRVHYAKLLHQRSNRVVNQIEKLKTKLSKLPPYASNEAAKLMLDNRGAFLADLEIRRYLEWIEAELEEEMKLPKFFSFIRKNNPLYEAYLPRKQAVFSKAYFSNVLPAAAQTMLTHKQMMVKEYERYILWDMTFPDRSWIKFSPIFACIYAPSHQIEVGNEYTADMIVGTTAHAHRPYLFTINRQTMKIKNRRYDNAAKISLKTQNTGKKYWEGKITYQIGYKRDTTIVHQTYYEVLPRQK